MDDNPYRAPQQEITSFKHDAKPPRKRWTMASLVFLVPAMLGAAWTLGQVIAWYGQPGIVDVMVPFAIAVSSAFTLACFLLAMWLRR